MYRIEKYTTAHYSRWNEFAAVSKNGTFLFQRDFMEYHADRFEDYSLLVLKEEKLMALLPANKVGNEVQSHGGLTYGGLVYDAKAKLADIIKILQAVLQFLNESGIAILYYKAIPAIYYKMPAQEAEYALFAANAKLVRRDSLFVYDTAVKPEFSRKRKQALTRAVKSGLKVIEEADFELFWNRILIPNMAGKHGVLPVHSLNEIQLLHNKFPENIRQFNVYKGNEIVAGTTMFVTDTVAHPQHISGQKDKNELGSLDFLYAHLLDIFRDKKYFDFGPSNLDDGRKLNETLAFWKESFGARTILQDFYEVETANYTLLDNVII